MDKAKKSKNSKIPKAKQENWIKAQIQILEGSLKKTESKIGFSTEGVATYFMIGTDICYKIPSTKLLLDPKKLPESRLIKMAFYKELFKKSQKLIRIYRRKTIRGETYAVFRLGDKQICIPSNRLNNFAWASSIFFGIDDFSPVFVLTRGRGHGNFWTDVQGFVMPVPVSTYILTAKDLQKTDVKISRPKKNLVGEGSDDADI